MKHVWKRDVILDGKFAGIQTAMTDDLTPPDNSGDWRLASFPAIGRVEGAGQSPSRPSKA